MSKKFKKTKKKKRPEGPSEIQGQFNSAIHFYQVGLLGQAQKTLGEIIAKDPTHLDSYKLLSDIALQTGQADFAISILTKTVAYNPKNPVCRGYLADLLSQIGRFAEAIPHYEEELALSGKNRKFDADMLLLNTAIAYMNAGNPLKAIDKLKMAIENNSKNTLIYYNLASTYQALGEIEKAKEFAIKSLEIDPLYSKSLYILSIIDKSFFSTELIEKIRDRANDQGSPIEDRIYLSFTLYSILKAAGKFDESFAFLEVGNKLKRQTTHYNLAKQVEYFRKVREILSKFLSINNAAIPPINPIFIIGMPRSGTTLIEQIIASHKEVTAGGEISIINQIVQSIMNEIYSTTPPNEISALSADNLQKYSQFYMAGIQYLLHGNARSITDKMPQNFLYLGLIKSIFPNAKIIHCMRNPIATAFSCYETLFTARGQEFSNDLEELGRFYLFYQETISHWKAMIPSSILDVQYENIISNQEDETRRILEFCGLQWDDNCLEFYKTTRTVSTASVMQVRKPLYKSSLTMWKNYEKHLQPLIDLIGKV